MNVSNKKSAKCNVSAVRLCGHKVFFSRCMPSKSPNLIVIVSVLATVGVSYSGCTNATYFVSKKSLINEGQTQKVWIKRKLALFSQSLLSSC